MCAQPARAGLAALLAAGAIGAVQAQDAASADAGEDQRSWGLAPIRMRGLLAADLRWFRAEGQERRFEEVGSCQMQMQSYLWEPWFAQVQAGVGTVISSTHSAESSDSTSLIGNGMLNLFPVSRFPFRASFEIADSRTDDQFTGQTQQTRRYGVRQSYRDTAGDATSTLSYDRSTLVSSTQGEDDLDVFAASHVHRLGAHSLDANANFTRNERAGSDERTQMTRLGGRHGWSDGGLFTVDTTASYGDSQQKLAAGSTTSSSRNELFQANTFFSRRRDLQDPWSFTGGARYFQSASSGAAEASAHSLGGHLNGAYQYSRNLLANAGVSATQTSSSTARDRFLTTESAGLAYTADPVPVAKHLYNVNTGANFLNQTGEENGARQVASGQVGHNVQRFFDLGDPSALTATLAESLALAHDSSLGNLRTLAHNASLMWRLTRGGALAGFVSASAADSRSKGSTDSVFQMLNTQVSGQAQLERYSTVSANITVQGTRQETPQAGSGGFNVNVNGGLTYEHRRALGVAGLRYRAIYERNDYRLNSRAQGDLNAPREQVSESFEQRLEYRIGKLEARLSLRFADIDGRDTTLVFLRIARDIGD